MNEGNFSAWRQGRPGVVSLARPSAINYNFTFIPSNSGVYYFLFNNPDPVRKNVIFTLSAFETVVIVSPLLQYAGYVAMLVGLVISILAVKTGRKRSREAKVSETVDLRSKCKYCGERITAGEFCSKCGRSQT
jgi:ribosomal protein L32